VCWVGGQPRVENYVRWANKNTINERDVFKIERCGSYSQLPTGKMKQKVCRFISEIVSKKRLLSCSQWRAHCRIEMKKHHLRRRKRERPAPVDADVWVYRGTVYNTKGTTWSGSPLWKEAQQEVRPHWFIDSYISAYKQELNRVAGVPPTGLTVSQGCRQVSTLN
jgi:hypothetical protein